ncbi:hypothetical protein TESG_08610 [Trichophyton tonsurans CBS 112818]|uniref:Uncharacterized protein n=1 Tax=Trichophyton tonsurans (strain CBS 112818) TaxID=647933 RepID=F2S7W3_TRIT1|nr:hypothetical protein TESG_08610 [Trichophyton tonsurans CBS 112818]
MSKEAGIIDYICRSASHELEVIRTSPFIQERQVRGYVRVEPVNCSQKRRDRSWNAGYREAKAGRVKTDVARERRLRSKLEPAEKTKRKIGQQAFPIG